MQGIRGLGGWISSAKDCQCSGPLGKRSFYCYFWNAFRLVVVWEIQEKITFLVILKTAQLLISSTHIHTQRIDEQIKTKFVIQNHHSRKLIWMAEWLLVVWRVNQCPFVAAAVAVAAIKKQLRKTANRRNRTYNNHFFIQTDGSRDGNGGTAKPSQCKSPYPAASERIIMPTCTNNNNNKFATIIRPQ